MEIIKKLFVWLNSKSIRYKITLLLVFVSFLYLVSYILGYMVLSRSYTNILYQSLSGSLKYSAEDISQKLSMVESTTSSINSNKEIRKNLIILADETNDIRRRNAKNSLLYLTTDYFHRMRTSQVKNISLVLPDHIGFISSNPIWNDSIPKEVMSEILMAAKASEGYPVWITNYSNKYGLFIARDCRRVKDHNYESIGTLIINIDLDKLVTKSTNSILLHEEAGYIIYNNSLAFFKSASVPTNILTENTKPKPVSFGFINQNDVKYFYLDGTLDYFYWEYKCLIPYDNILNSIHISRSLYAIIATIALGIALASTNYLGKTISARFQTLVDQMRIFAVDASTYTPINNTETDLSDDEVEKLQWHFNEMATKIQSLIQKNYISELLNKDAKLKALENQINPHFLYNTLESVNWRAKSIKAKDISAMTEALGSLLRITLQKPESDFRVKDELELVRHYVTIQKHRFENRFIYSEKIDPDLLNLNMPKLTIQPLIENAIGCALEQIIEPCIVEVSGTKNNCELVISVTNNGSQFPENTLEKLKSKEMVPNGLGIGLLNIENRLKLMYGQKAGLVLFNSDCDHAVAQIRIPLNKQDNV